MTWTIHTTFLTAVCGEKNQKNNLAHLVPQLVFAFDSPGGYTVPLLGVELTPNLVTL